MQCKRDDYLTFYDRPDDATPEERAMARIACKIVLGSRHSRTTSWSDFFTAAGKLLFWKRQLVFDLVRAHDEAGHVAREPRAATRRTSTPLAQVFLRPDLRAAALVEPFQWEEVARVFGIQFEKNRSIRARLLQDSLAWIEAPSDAEPSTLSRNVSFLANELALTPVESTLLEFAVITRESEALRELVRPVSIRTARSAINLLAEAFGLRTEQVSSAVHECGVLAQLGLLATEEINDLEDLVRGSNERLYRALLQPHQSGAAFLETFLKPAAAATIAREDVSHLASFFDLATRLLAHALAKREQGVHVLLYGAPGAGKTEFARLLASAVQARLFEVEYEDEKGASANQKERLSSLTLAARALKETGNALLLFDEAEDAFTDNGHRGLQSEFWTPRRYAKAWMNRTLENLPVPVIWVSNSIANMDAAYLRRFSLHVRFPELPIHAKRRLTARYLSRVGIGVAVQDEVARLDALTPGQLQMACRVVELCDSTAGDEAEDVLRLQLRSAREAAGFDYCAGSRDKAIPYQPQLLNLREPMTVTRLLQGLRRSPRAAVCFYGQPGTGKTELAHHIAAEMGRELVYKSASDLLSPWVGVTEQKIAEVFSNAEHRRDDVIVLLDEADTFLRDRRVAHASWEASQTNEFLARIERFPGIFICTTNLVESLDLAVLRRFLFRVEFLALKPEQCGAIFAATFGREADQQERDELRRLSGLVPADFANVARQMRFLDSKEELSPVALLVEELRTRRGSALAPRAIGFIS